MLLIHEFYCRSCNKPWRWLFPRIYYGRQCDYGRFHGILIDWLYWTVEWHFETYRILPNQDEWTRLL
jgi:hypothetical protein